MLLSCVFFFLVDIQRVAQEEQPGVVLANEPDGNANEANDGGQVEQIAAALVNEDDTGNDNNNSIVDANEDNEGGSIRNEDGNANAAYNDANDDHDGVCVLSLSLAR